MRCALSMIVQGLVLLLLLAAAPQTSAQSLVPGSDETAVAAPALPTPLTEETANALISRLSDSEVRALLLQQLNTQVVAEENARGGLSQLFSIATVGVVQSVGDAFGKLPELGRTLSRAVGVFMDRLGTNGLTLMLVTMTIAIISAALIEFGFRRLVRSWVENIRVSASPSLRDTLAFLAKRLTADIVAVMIFFVSATMIASTIGPRLGMAAGLTPQQGAAIGYYVGPIWFNLIVLPRIGWAVARFLLAPQRPEFRIIHTDDATARGIYLHQGGWALLMGLTFWVPQFLVMNGEELGNARAGFWLNLAIHIYVIWIYWRYRSGLSLMMRGADPNVTPGEALVARAYPWFVMVASVVTWWLASILGGFGLFELLVKLPHIWTLLLMSYAPFFDLIVRGLVRHLMPPMTGEGMVAERAYESSRRSYIRIGRVIAFALVMAAIARIWQIDLSNLAAAGVGTQLAGRLIEMLMILAVGYLIYESVSLWINRKLAAEMTALGGAPEEEEIGGEGGGAGGSRLSTVLPLILGVARAAIVVVFVLLALGNAGIDTTPLLAGAGIVGLAIGFGAQKLVTDVVSGIFFLIDDAFRTGEYVEVEGTMGTVEKISIRSMQLRHHKGPVHTLPYGEIPKITNFSRDWVIMKLRFTVPFGTDPNKVKKIFKRIGAEMMEEELFKDDFLQPFKSQGVLEFDDVGMVIRGKFMAKPGTQFTIRKEIFNRVNKAFEENGIDFARREVRVALPGLDDTDKLTDEDKASIAAAATQAAQEMAEAAPAAPKPGD